MVALPGAPPIVALVMTLWPASKKPRPIVHDVALDRVKAFRAILLNEHPTDSGRMQPSEHMWRYIAAQVVAVLDVDQAKMETGDIFLTQRSVDAIHKLKEQLAVPDGETGAVKRKKTIKPPSFKEVQRRLRKNGETTAKPKKDASTSAVEEAWLSKTSWAELKGFTICKVFQK